MNAREYLNSIIIAGKRIKQKEARIVQLHESLLSVSVPMDQEQVSHTRNVSVMAETVACITDMERELDQQLEQLYLLRREALRFFDKLEPAYAQILTLKYYDDLSAREIAKKLSYSRSSVFRILTEATNIDTGERFRSIRAASASVNRTSQNSHIRDCCEGRRKIALGYHWRYADT